jgi:MurNAc alpha-1-phosphate uridylyltransferase
VINGDVFSPNLPIAQLLEQVSSLRSMPNQPLAHLLMVPNPVQHPEGDFYLKGSQVASESLADSEKLTFSGIGIYHQDLFKDLELDVPTKLAPLLREAMAKNRVSGEKYAGPWHDVGTPQRLQELNAAHE